MDRVGPPGLKPPMYGGFTARLKPCPSQSSFFYGIAEAVPFPDNSFARTYWRPADQKGSGFLPPCLA
jgi:hypothetical protein